MNDNKPTTNTQTHSPKPFVVGDKVLVADEAHKECKVCGVVTAVKEDGTCSIESEDGKKAFNAAQDQLVAKPVKVKTVRT